MKVALYSLAAFVFLGTAGLVVNANDGCMTGACKADAPTTQASAPVNTKCPIQKDNAIDPKVTYVYGGKTVGFCCPDCIGEFKKNPEKYMKELK